VPMRLASNYSALLLIFPSTPRINCPPLQNCLLFSIDDGNRRGHFRNPAVICQERTPRQPAECSAYAISSNLTLSAVSPL
jgi:hypothetical protein